MISMPSPCSSGPCLILVREELDEIIDDIIIGCRYKKVVDKRARINRLLSLTNLKRSGRCKVHTSDRFQKSVELAVPKMACVLKTISACFSSISVVEDKSVATSRTHRAIRCKETGNFAKMRRS